MGRLPIWLLSSRLFYTCAQLRLRQLGLIAGVLLLSTLIQQIQNSASAACGGTVRTWDSGGGNTNWRTANNWSANNIPNSAAEDVVIVSSAQIPNLDASQTVGCVEIQSGTLTLNTASTLTISGDYFRNLTVNSVTNNSNATILMSGTTAQTFENYDDVDNLAIGNAANDQNVTITKPFTLNGNLTFTAGWAGTLYVNADIIYNGGAVTVPAGATVVIGDGAKITTYSNWTIAGTLKLMPGSSMNLGDGEVLTVNNGGQLIIAGASGNSAKIFSQDISDIFTLNLNGILNANYFLFGRMTTAGLNIGATGVVQKLDNGEFHYPQTNGNAITIAAGASLPATMDNVGFTNDFNTTGVRNVNSAYTGANVSFTNWTGTNGGNANERADAGNRIGWGTQGATKLTVTDASDPPTTINQNTTATVANFSFALNQTATATNITSVKITMIGTASTSDINYIEVFRDVAGSMNCLYNGGTDASITGQVSLTGNPLSYTVTIPAGNVSTSSDTARHCIHVRVNTTATAQDAKTIQFSIEGTSDVVNSQGYAFSDSASPPVVVSPATTINGDPVRKWQGDGSTAWNTAGNWNGGVPTGTNDCEIGTGVNVTVLNAAGTCQVATFKTGATFDFGAAGRILNITGGLEIQSGVTFQNPATVGVLNFSGAVAEGVKISTPVPANLTITNTGAAGNDYVEINGDTQIGNNSGNGGDVTINNGTLRVNAPYTLTIKGNLVCAALAGNAIEIAPGATLKMGNGRTITINNGCTLRMLGTSSNNSVITGDSTSSSYNVVVAAGGTISAKYYTFSNLGTLGLRIAGTIDATNHLQNGTFTYPLGASGKMLDLDVVVPTNSLDDMTFSLNGSAATGTINVDTVTIGSAGTLTLNNYTGDLAGPTYDNDGTYLLSWLGATNTIKVTQEATSPTPLNAGSTYNMGRFGFQQVQAGASYSNTDITSLRLTLTGTASANDISDVKVYYDDGCTGSGGVLIDSGTLSGNPASRNFTFSAGELTVNADATAPPKRCIYVEYVIAASAINGNTAGVQIASASDIVNSQNYAVDATTQPPINLGTAGTIAGATSVTWLGTTSAAWATGANWSTGAVPTSAQNCSIDSSINNPTISVAGAVCKTITIGNGTLTINTGQKLSVYGGFTNTGTLILNGTATIEFADGGVASNQTITSTSTIGNVSFNKTAGSGNVNIASSALTITTLATIAQTFDFLVPAGKNLTITNSATVNAGTFTIAGGGTVTMGNGTTFTVGAAGSLIMVGDSSSALATMTSAGGYGVALNGTISARYYQFDHLSGTGLNIASGANINVTNHLQDGNFTYPNANNTTMLTLNRQVPTDTMANTRFNKNGSAVTGHKNINTTGVGAGTLTLDQYSGDFAGDSFETEGTYAINWTGGMNTIDVTQDAATALGSVTAPSTANLMGRFAFKQSVAGASFSDANMTTLKLTMKGTATAADISAVRIYSETDCNSAGGTLIGTGTFSGSPASVTFNLSAGNAVILHHATTPPKVCIYVEYDIASGATNGNTVGVEVNASTHTTNDQGFVANPTTIFPVNLGNAITINGATNTNWVGGTSTNPTVAGNWSNGLPSSTINCTIPSSGVTNNMLIAAGMTVTCKSVNLLGTMSMTGGTWDVHGDFANSGSLTHSGGILNFQGTANQNFSSGSTIFSLGFGKTAGTVFVTGNNVPITTISFAGGSGYTFYVNPAKAVTIANSFAVATGKTLQIGPSGTLKMANGTTVTINAGGTLRMVGTSSSALATMTSSGAANAFNVAISGNVEARYYQFDHLNTAGVNLTGATINATNHFQDGNFLYPVNNSTTLFKTNVVIPTGTMDNCKFDLNGSAATGTVTVDVSAVASAGTTTFNSYTGGLAGGNHVNNGTTHTVVWAGGLNTINITREASSPANVNAGSTYNMGRFGFQQTLAGSGYLDADITSLKLTTTGTAVASDISAVRIYYDSDCDGLAGTLIGSGAFTGSPLTKTFTLSAGDATIPMHATSPPKRCIYVEMDIAAGAANANTISAKINASADFVNSRSYTIASALPVTLATTPATITGATSTTWTGTTNTTWETGTNWTNGVPDNTKSCTLVNVTNDPVITAVDGVCKNMSIGNGILTINTGRKLQVQGNYDNTGGTLTFNGTGTLEIADAGAGSTQTISSTAAQSLAKLTFAKTGNGIARINSNMTLTTPTFPASQAFTLLIPSGSNLTVSNGFSFPAGTTIEVAGGGILTMGASQTLTVGGGTFKTSGTNDTFTQSSANKGKITSASGTWTFNATSGTVDLTGFWFDNLTTNGLQITGSTNLTNLNGGQFTNLVTNGRGMTINTTGSVPSTATNVGFQWGAFNAYRSATDCLAGTYYTVFTTGSGCSGNTITFDQWFGNWWPGQNPAVNCTPDNHIQNTACTISMASSASPVAITSLTATPYDTAVDIRWQTGSEVDHMGFNVYRSRDVASGYVQINSSLIRNVLTSTSNHGLYRFIDTQVTNGTLYYYMVEDVSFNGSKEKHGPVSATPLAGLGAPPATPGGTNDGGSSDSDPNDGNDPTNGPIATPGVIDLGNGVHILAQTQNSLRLEIIPPPGVWSNSAWNATYKTLKVPGYANTAQEGYPELVERTILVEVSSQHSTASISNASVTETAGTAKKVQPAPSWALDVNNVLQPSYAENATAYSAAGFQPSAYYSLDSALKVVNGKAFVSLKVNPYKYDAPNQQVKNASKIVLDITLDGEPIWDNQPPSVATSISPSAADGALRMKFTQSGMYEITYSDLATANVDGPFAGRDSSLFRMYVRGQEIPIKILAGSSTFSSGDKIRFFVNHIRDVDDDHNEVVLSNYNILNSSSAPWRMDNANADPTSFSPSPEQGSYLKISSEQDNIYLIDYPLGDGEDHFYWQRIYAEKSGSRNPYPAHASMTMNVDLTGHIQNSTRPVYLRVYLRARAANSVNATHHLGVYLNGINYLIDEKSFTTDLPTRIDFTLSANYFFSGTNSIKLIALADMVPDGDWDFLDIDRIELEFEGDRIARNNKIDFTNRFKNYYINMFGFGGNDVTIYDVSQSNNRVTVLDNVNWTTSDGGVTHDAAFATVDNAEHNMGTRYVGVREGQYLKPVSMKLQQGSYIPLKSTVNAADLIIVGEKSLLAYMDRLVSIRENEGLRVVKAALEDVYAEFSNGMATPDGLRDFVIYAYSNWTAPKPKYLLIVGDGTYDPRDRWDYDRADANRLAPVSMVSGLYIDFGSDNYFVTDPDVSDTPLLSVGRIPTSDPAVLDDYITKILSYEAGTTAPTASGLLQAAFINDQNSNGESFSAQADEIKNTLLMARPDYTASKVDRDVLTDAAAKAAIIAEFNSGPYFMTYMGHGAEDRWASSAFFMNADAAALTNTRYPIVMALNCLNGYFYDADPTYDALGEKLIFNKNGGAIAFWGSTAMTVPTMQRNLTTGFINEFAAATSSGVTNVRLGDIQQRAKQTMGADQNSKDVIRSWVLLGDPSMRLPSGVFRSQSTDLTSTDDDKKGHGFLSCGSINSGPMNPMDILSSVFEMLLLIGALMTLRTLIMKQRLRVSI